MDRTRKKKGTNHSTPKKKKNYEDKLRTAITISRPITDDEFFPRNSQNRISKQHHLRLQQAWEFSPIVDGVHYTGLKNEPLLVARELFVFQN